MQTARPRVHSSRPLAVGPTRRQRPAASPLCNLVVRQGPAARAQPLHSTSNFSCAKAVPAPLALYDVLNKCARTALTASAAIFLALSLNARVADAAEYVSLPVSLDPGIVSAQQTMLEAWEAVDSLFFDDDALRGWDKSLATAMQAAYASDSKESAFEEINTMLTTLGDPYTRLVPSSAYQDFRVTADGEVSGVGLLLAAEPSTHAGGGGYVVLAPVHGSPAERAGIAPGDVLVSIDGTPTTGLSDSAISDRLRGVRGSHVAVTLTRSLPDVPPGIASRSAPPTPAQSRSGSAMSTRTLTLQRDKVELSPVLASEIGNHLAYIRLATFSHNAASEMAAAVMQLQSSGARAFILDLRNNPGGLVTAGLDVARLWLEGDPTVFAVSGRDQNNVQPIALEQGRALSNAPLVVLVNGKSASAAEIVAGALHDHGRAKIFGDTSTYGKGRIQSVYEMSDGSALFVSVARYLTPNLTPIDHVGIRPDITCALPKSSSVTSLSGSLALYGSQSLNDHLFEDPCFLAAEKMLTRQMRSSVADRSRSSLLSRVPPPPSATLPLAPLPR